MVEVNIWGKPGPRSLSSTLSIHRSNLPYSSYVTTFLQFKKKP